MLSPLNSDAGHRAVQFSPAQFGRVPKVFLLACSIIHVADPMGRVYHVRSLAFQDVRNCNGGRVVLRSNDERTRYAAQRDAVVELLVVENEHPIHEEVLAISSSTTRFPIFPPVRVEAAGLRNEANSAQVTMLRSVPSPDERGLPSPEALYVFCAVLLRRRSEDPRLYPQVFG